MSDYLQVLTTTATREEAEGIARELLEARLAACVQIVGPISSLYHWQGQIETSAEWQCVIKTRRALWDALCQAVRRRHSYQVPEIIALPIEAGDGPYLAWLEAETTPPSLP